jgi:hypothetical protein
MAAPGAFSRGAVETAAAAAAAAAAGEGEPPLPRSSRRGENDSSRSAVGSEDRSSPLLPASLAPLPAAAVAAEARAETEDMSSTLLALLSAAASASALTAAASRILAASSSLPASRSMTSKKRSGAACSETGAREAGEAEGEEEGPAAEAPTAAAEAAAPPAAAVLFSSSARCRCSLSRLPTSLLLHAPRTPPARLARGFAASASPTITASATLPAVAATPCSITSNVVVTARFRNVLTGPGSSRKTVSSSRRANDPASTPGTSVTKIEWVSAPRDAVVMCLILRDTASVQ